MYSSKLFTALAAIACLMLFICVVLQVMEMNDPCEMLPFVTYQSGAIR